MFDYAAGDKFYDEAASLDAPVVSRFNAIASKNPNRTVIDSVYGKQDLEAFVASNRAASASIFPLGNVAGMIGAGVLLLIFTVMSFTDIALAGRCTNCGKVICERCAPGKTYGGKCASCYRLLSEFDDTSPRAKVARMLSTMRIKDKLRDRIKALSFAPPGVAQIYAGKLTEGLLYLVGFIFLLISSALTALPTFTVGLAGLTHSWLTPWLLIAAVMLYGISFVSVNRRVEMGWL